MLELSRQIGRLQGFELCDFIEACPAPDGPKGRDNASI